jgi:hypothetical protein
MYPWREELTMTAYRDETMRQAEHYQLVKEARRFVLRQQNAASQLLIHSGEALVNLGTRLQRGCTDNGLNVMPAHAK